MPQLRAAYGIARSLAIYYGQPWKLRRRRQLYRGFISPGDLCFDVGAHVGNRVSSWLGLGARVLAIEPQSDLMRILRLLYGHHPRVALRECALADVPGTRRIHISSASPTVSSLSSEWMREVKRDPRFGGVRWDRSCEVQVETLDRLIASHGKPAFCKIDVEGCELEVLSGLTQPLAGISFEYIPVALPRALACVQRLRELGDYEYRPSEVETMRWATGWLGPDAMCEWLRGRALSAGSGDVYARLTTAVRVSPT